MTRIVETEACIDEGCAWLVVAEPRFAAALAQTGRPPLRRVPDGFTALRDIVMGQVVSVAVAGALVGRLDAAGLTDEAAVAGADPEALRACGLSRQKARTLQAIAGAGLDFVDLRAASDTEVAARLTAIPGIGPWTAQIYLIQALGRADAFAPGDLAKQEAVRLLFGLPDRPGAAALARMAAAWSPWRAVAARVLWAYYRTVTQREGLR